MKPVMKMYVEKGPILPGKESQAENNQTRENRTSKNGQPTYPTAEEKAQWEEVAPKKPREAEGAP